MKFSRKLQDFSLPEAFKLIAEGRKSGLLSIRIFDESTSGFKKNYISVEAGVVTGLFENFDGRDLITWLTTQSDLLAPEQSKQVMRLTHNLSEHKNLGDYLIAHQFLSSSQVQTIFKTQVSQPIHRLFQSNNGLFIFSEKADIPSTELTGLSIAIPELIISGLHQLTDWSVFADKLPEPQSALLQISPVSAQYRELLNPIEIQLIDTANGYLSLSQLARQWGYEVKLLQQAAFCLVVTGLLEELPIANTVSSNQRASVTPVVGTAIPGNIAQTQHEHMSMSTPNPVMATANLQYATSPTQPQHIANSASHQISSDSLSPSGIRNVGALPHPQLSELSEPGFPSASGRLPSHSFLDKLSNFFSKRIASHQDDLTVQQ